MPRYFFDIRNGDGLIPDEEGTDLPDLQAAQLEAARTLADMSRDHAINNAPHRLSVEVKDDQQKPLLEAVLTLEVRPLTQ